MSCRALHTLLQQVAGLLMQALDNSVAYMLFVRWAISPSVLVQRQHLTFSGSVEDLQVCWLCLQCITLTCLVATCAMCCRHRQTRDGAIPCCQEEILPQPFCSEADIGCMDVDGPYLPFCNLHPPHSQHLQYLMAMHAFELLLLLDTLR